jgi:MoxR-like ATPase
MENPQTLNQTSASPASAEEVKIGEARIRLENLTNELKRVVIGHEEVVDVLVLALVAREHVVMIGPPGTAKSFLALSLARRLNARYYTYLMTKFTTFDELVGYVDVLALSKGELRRKLSAIVEADIVFLDEIFKASSPILNALLSLMQERVIYDPFTGTAIPARLWTLIGASNEVPDDDTQAVYDRFAVKIFVKPVSNMNTLTSILEAKWLRPPAEDVAATMEDVKTVHDYAESLLRRRDVLQLYQVHMMPLFSLVENKGIYISDRTKVEKMPWLFAAHLALHGVSEARASEAAYRLIKLIARNGDELAEIEKALNEMLGELSKLIKTLDEAKKLYDIGELNSALNLFRQVALFDVESLKEKPWIVERAKALVQEAQEYITLIQENLAKLKRLRDLAQP